MEVQWEFTRRNYFHSPLKQTLPNPSHSGFSRAQSALLLSNRSYKRLPILSITRHSGPGRQQPSSQVSLSLKASIKPRLKLLAAAPLTLAAVLLGAAKIILIVRIGICGGTCVAAHGALPLTLQDTSLQRTADRINFRIIKRI